MKNVVYFFLFCTMILSLGFPVTSDSVLANEISVSTPTPPVPELEFFGHLPEEAELHHGFEEQFAFPHNLTERYQEEEYELESPVINPPTAEELAQTQAQVASYDCALVTDVPKGECEALVALYASTNGAGWSNSKNWLTSTLVGDWYGLSLYNGHVSDISLSSNQLSGTIPPELGNLTNLRSLYLYSNQLSGTIPPELGNLTNLYELWLSSNQLSGTIPPEFGNLTKLWYLYLSSNQLSGTIPTQLASLTNLWNLGLSSNQLSGTIPTQLGNLTQLRGLFLGDNQLSGTIPSSLGNQPYLWNLNLSSNQLSGPIPPQLGSLTSLVYLVLGDNQLSGTIPSELGNPPDLGYLDLSSNQLSGTIPSELGSLLYLWELSLSSNQLSGTIPPELGNLTDLQVFDLNDNQLSGSIPPELGNLTDLQVFDLNDNQLSGSIPPELGNLTTLIGLDLSVNQFSGDVPDSLTNLVNLCEPGNMDYPCYGIYELDLGYNYLNVPAPEPPAGFLAIKDPDWYLTQAVEADIPGETGGDLDSNDGNTEIVIPADAVEGLLTLFFVPRPYPSHNIGVLRFAGNSFKLTASIGETPIATFAKPLTLTLHYSEDALHSIPEDSLLLYYWDTDQLAWVDAVSTCEGGVYTRNFDENWLSLPICHLSEFALIGDALDIFLPVIIR